jgi:hypothetical protein
MRNTSQLPYRGSDVIWYRGAVKFSLLRQVGFDPVFLARVTEADFGKYISKTNATAKVAKCSLDGIEWTHEFSRKHWTGRMTTRRADVLISTDGATLEPGADPQADPWQTTA